MSGEEAPGCFNMLDLFLTCLVCFGVFFQGFSLYFNGFSMARARTWSRCTTTPPRIPHAEEQPEDAEGKIEMMETLEIMEILEILRIMAILEIMEIKEILGILRLLHDYDLTPS